MVGDSAEWREPATRASQARQAGGGGCACELMEEGWEDSLSESLFGGEAAGELGET